MTVNKLLVQIISNYVTEFKYNNDNAEYNDEPMQILRFICTNNNEWLIKQELIDHDSNAY